MPARQRRKKKPTLELLVGAWHLLRQIMAFGNPTGGGFVTMAEALRAVQKLNLELPKNLKMAVSGHWWHEIRSPIRPEFNNPRAIDLQQWIDGAIAGHYAPIGRIIPPGFGLPGSDQGAFISPDPNRRHLAHQMMIQSFEASEQVKESGAGKGDVIYWTGPDGIRWERLVKGDDVRLGYGLNPKLEEWNLIVDGLVRSISAARRQGFTHTKLFFEGKSGGDPCYLDAFTDTRLEIAGINQINQRLGTDVAFWQGEFCHSRGGGQKFASALRQAIAAGVFDGQIHFNSGGLGQVSFSKLLAKRGGTPASLFQQYVDPDYLPGEGVAEWVEDQEATLAVGAEWSYENQRPFEVEFDARFCRRPGDTIEELRRSVEWTALAFERAAARFN